MPNPKKKAEKLMNRSEKLKKIAEQQEKIGRYEIANKVPVRRSVEGDKMLHGKERIERAALTRQKASEDSLRSVKLSQMGSPKKKK
jgi:hypothetical protein